MGCRLLPGFASGRPFYTKESIVMRGSRKVLGTGFSFALALALQTGCASVSNVAQKPADLQGQQESVEKPTAEAPRPKVLEGKVVESMDAGSYTYILLENNTKKTWVAVPTTKVSVGQELRLKPGTEMGKFSSKTLNRTFDNIIFTSGPVNEQKQELPSGHPSIEKENNSDAMVEKISKQMKGHTMGGGQSMGGAPVKLAGKVVETLDGGGYTYICIEQEGKKKWAAVPSMKVSVGQEVESLPGVEMPKFESKTLNRTFENIIFTDGLVNQ